MKKTMIVFLLAWSAQHGYSQQTDPTVSLNKESLLLKSKREKTIGIVFASSGLILSTIGISTFVSEFDILPGGDTNESKADTGEALAVVGGGLLLASIPFIVSSRIHKKKALSLGLKNESAQVLLDNFYSFKTIPSLSLKLSL